MRFFYAILAGAITLLPSALWAQQGNRKPGLDLAVLYNAQRGGSTSGNSFWMQGGEAELMATWYNGLGLAADLSGVRAAEIGQAGVGLSLVTTTFGPTYTLAIPRKRGSKTQWNAFGEALFGIAHGFDSVFPGPSGAQSSAQSFALQMGGGADWIFSRHLAIRVLKADWMRTQLPNGGSNRQNNFRIGTGITFRLTR